MVAKGGWYVTFGGKSENEPKKTSQTCTDDERGGRSGSGLGSTTQGEGSSKLRLITERSMTT
jgi:hypothetical protein